jgi:hypothetical protein
MPRRARLDVTPLVITTIGKPSLAGLDLLAEYVKRRIDAERATPPNLEPVPADEPGGPVPQKL